MCQLIEYNLMAENPNFFGSIWQFNKRLIRFSKNRSYLIGYQIKKMFLGTKSRTIAANNADFQPGEMVRVRSKAEIVPTLDGYISYYYFPRIKGRSSELVQSTRYKLLTKISPKLPDPLFKWTGQLLYRHLDG